MVYWSDHKVDLDIMANYLNYTEKELESLLQLQMI